MCKCDQESYRVLIAKSIPPIARAAARFFPYIRKVASQAVPVDKKNRLRTRKTLETGAQELMKLRLRHFATSGGNRTIGCRLLVAQVE